MNAANYLKILWKQAPLSWAIIRAVECELLSKQVFSAPILEVGCGDGLVTQVLFENKKNAIDLGIDLDREELRRAQKTAVYKRVLQKDICNTGLSNNLFNTVFSNGVLEHVPNLDKALSEIARLLKPKGILITTSPMDSFTNLLFYYRLLNSLGFPDLAEQYGSFINRRFVHRHLLPVSEWKKRLAKAGLKLVEYHIYNNPQVVALHDMFLPFALGSKSLKAYMNRLVLFPNVRKILQLPLTPFVSSFIQDTENEPKTYGSILILAKKL